MTEGRAILIAGAAHLALLGLLSMTWSAMHDSLPAFTEAVPVEIVEISDLPRITEPPKPSIEAAPQETIEAAAPEPTPEETAEAEPEPTPAPPEPAPAEVPTPEAKPKPKPEPKVEAKPKAEAKAKAEKKAPERLDTQELANLLDKSLPKAKQKPLDTSDFAKSIEKSLPKGARLDARATATLEQAIRAQIQPCWNPPIGGADVGKMTVLLRIEMARDGKVIGVPEVVGQTGIQPGNQAYARAFAESARRAVVRCSPLELPDEMYEAWREFELNFDPSKMS